MAEGCPFGSLDIVDSVPAGRFSMSFHVRIPFSFHLAPVFGLGRPVGQARARRLLTESSPMGWAKP